MKVRHKKLLWEGRVIDSREETEGLICRTLWQNQQRAWKTWDHAKALVFIVPSPTRRINNA